MRKRSGGGEGRNTTQQTMAAAFGASVYTKIKEADLSAFVEKELP